MIVHSDSKELKPKHILLVEDEDFFRDVLKKALEKQGHRVSSASDGKAAQYIFGIEHFDVVISDLKMPGMSGLELLNEVRSCKNTPFILITGFSSLIETQMAHAMGANGFLLKPFKQEDILDAIGECFKEEKAPQVPLDSLFCKISIDDFTAGFQVPFEIYIRLSATKYIKIAHEGESLDMDRLKQYKTKNILHFHLKREDYHKYLGLSLTLVRAAKNSKQIPFEKKQRLVKHAGEVVLEHLHGHDVNDESITYVKTYLESTLDVLAADESAFDLLSALAEHSDSLHAHSLGVCAYAVLLARKMDWNLPSNQFKVAVCGLLHDIGKKSLPKEFAHALKKELSSDEMAVYKTHSKLGADIIGLVDMLPSDISQIILEHHEECDGSGFPLKLTKNRISPIARVVNICDKFCNLAIVNPNGPGMSASHALDAMQRQYLDQMDPDIFQQFKTVFSRNNSKKK